jgi:zinc/manganese transport system substrate-binding protein
MRHLAASILVLAGLAAAAPAHAAVEIVATVPDLASIAKEIGGAKVRVTALSLPSQDPHFVDAKPSLVLRLNRADLLIAVGLDLEVGWLPPLQTQARNRAIQRGGRGYLECASHVRVLDAVGAAADRAEGDVHPGGNPHYLYDPRQAVRCARAIGARLGALDPGNARHYRANLDAFVARLEAARRGWEQRLAAHRGEPVISYHKSMTYLVAWLGLDEVTTLEPRPGIPPTSRHVASVIKVGKQRGVRVILQEGYYPDRTSTLVARKLGARVVKLPGGADVGRGETYLDHMERFVADLEAALR